MLKPKKAAAVAKLKLRTFPLCFDLISPLQINNKFSPWMTLVFIWGSFSREIMFSMIVFGRVAPNHRNFGKTGLINMMFPEQLKETFSIKRNWSDDVLNPHGYAHRLYIKDGQCHHGNSIETVPFLSVLKPDVTSLETCLKWAVWTPPPVSQLSSGWLPLSTEVVNYRWVELLCLKYPNIHLHTCFGGGFTHQSCTPVQSFNILTACC